MDFTEVHSFMTRGEAILQSPEFSVSRKDGSIQELQDKVQVKQVPSHLGGYSGLMQKDADLKQQETSLPQTVVF